MKRGKDEDKNMGPMFPRLHVNDTEKGGPRAPPRNKMALYEQLSIPSQRYNVGVTSSSIPGTMNEHKRRQEEDDFRVPIFDQQSETSQHRTGNHNHKNRENEDIGITPFGTAFSGRLPNTQNARQNNNNNKLHKENSQDFRAPNNGNLRDYRVDSQAENTLWGDSGYGNNSVMLREAQEEGSRSPNDRTDAVSETSMVDSICGVDISPDDVVGIIGQKHFWKARRAIVNQQRVFAVQVFELHRLIKVQRLIAGSPHLLIQENTYLTKPPIVHPIKKIPLDSDLEKPNDDVASLSSVQNNNQTTNRRPLGGAPVPPSEPNTGPWNLNGPAGHHQWLIPVMTPSEGIVYKPYPGPGFVGPVGSVAPVFGHNFGNYGTPPSNHHYNGPTTVNPFAPPPPTSHGYFPSYSMQSVNPSVSTSTRFEPSNPHHHGSSTNPFKKTGPAGCPIVAKSNASKDTEVQASTASSRSDRTKDRNALPLFPTFPSSPGPDPDPVRVETTVPTSRVIRVVPHNARSATASVAWIFKSIQDERKQCD